MLGKHLWGFGVLLWLSALSISAQTALPSADHPQRVSASVKLLQSPDGEWRLQAQQADLPQLLDKIAEQAHLQVHYSVLPAATVNATCIGGSVVELLQCIFSGSANIVSRKAATPAAKDEIWVMSSSLASATVVSASCQDALSSMAEAEVNDRAEYWLKQAKSKDAQHRAQAIAELRHVDAAYDVRVRKILLDALSDRQSLIRARAIASFSGREGESSAIEQLRKALQDSSSDVRMSAMDAIQKDETLLQLAAHDADQTIRELAHLKLELLTQHQ